MNQSSPSNFPVGTIVYYGPDDQTITKLVASIFAERGAEPLRRTWRGNNLTTNPGVLAELGAFFKEHQVQRVVTDQRVSGCPHESGVDYPAGEACPYCPFWAKM